MSTTKELLDCPFCQSGKLGVSDKTTTINWKRKRHVAVYCKSCNTYGPRIIGEEVLHNHATDEARAQAIAAWNTRVKPDGGEAHNG